MEVLILIHILFTISLFTIPFWPIEFLKYGIYIPLLVSIIWLICDGCPLSKLHGTETNSYSQDLLKKLNPNVSEKFADNLNTFILIAITLIAFIRLNQKCL
jgi:hypothetical protein